MAKAQQHIKLLTPKRKEERWIPLARKCDSFVAELNKASKATGARAKYSVDDPTLYDVLMSTYYDIERYKTYHQNDPHNQKSDSVKRAAYYTKWIVRLHPISIYRPHGYQPIPDDDWAFANERFAIEWGFANLSFELGRRFPIPSEDFMFDLLYYLHYRSLAEDALVQMYQFIYDTGTQKKLFANLNP